MWEGFLYQILEKMSKDLLGDISITRFPKQDARENESRQMFYGKVLPLIKSEAN